MSKYTWFKDYQELQQQIETLEFNIERNKAELQRWVHGDLSNVKLTEKSHGAQLEEVIELQQNELAHKMNDLENMKKLINMFKGLDNKILYMKHVEGKTLEQISIELKYSYGYIKRKHADIIKMIKFADSLVSNM